MSHPALATPEYRALRARVDSSRSFVFAALPCVVCGIEIRLMTPTDYERLVCARNAFLVGGERTVADAAAFLWFLSPDFSLDEQAKQSFYEKPHAADAIELFRAIDDYLEMILCDQPGRRKGDDDKPSIGSLSAIIDDALMNAYPSWPPGRTATTALPALFQYFNCIRSRNGFPATDPARARAIGDHLRSKQNEANPAAVEEASA